MRVADRHTGLESAWVQAYGRPTTVEGVQAWIREAPRVCVAGRFHAGGGQQMADGAWLLDLTGLRGIRGFRDGLLEVEAGAEWPEIVAFLRREAPQWTIRQKQSVARVTLGGTVAANAHGNGLGMPPIGADVESLELVDGEGRLLRCSRAERADWFRMAVGGYGLVGAITAVRLRLRPRAKVRLLADFVRAGEVAEAMARRAAEGALYATCEMAPGLAQGMLLYQVPDEAGSPGPDFRENAVAWVERARRLHRDRAGAWREACAGWLELAGRTWWADQLLMSEGYVDGYHRGMDGCDPIVELLVPPQRLAWLLERVRGLDVLLCSIRAVGADTETALPYAPRASLAVAIMAHVASGGVAAWREAVRRCLDHAMASGGRFHPTFARIATADRLRACFPQFDAFVAEKRRLDPRGRFGSAWFDAYGG